MGEASMLETWRNVAPYVIGVFVTDAARGEVNRRIEPGREFQINSDDRRNTEMQIMRAANNPFRNGNFQPVVVENVEDLEQLSAQPNWLPQSEIDQALKGTKARLQERLARIDSLPTLQHILGTATAQKLGASKIEVIEDRIAELRRGVSLKARRAREQQGDHRDRLADQGEPGLPAPQEASQEPDDGAPEPQDADFYDMGAGGVSVG
jgi:hypothetical protein